MPPDRFFPAMIRSAQLSVGLANTTATCRRAQHSQELATTSAIALGRLLTAAALAALVRERMARMSLQVLCQGKLSQAYADVSPNGDARGYVRNRQLALPLFPDETPNGRRSIAVAVGEGTLSVIREPPNQLFTQSATQLVSGEIDLDVEHFLATSVQVPTSLTCDVLIGDDGAVSAAGGIIVQALPGADLDRLQQLREALGRGQFAARLTAHNSDLASLLKEIAPDAEPIDGGTGLRWRCRCSRKRVVSALGLLGPLQLAEMIQLRETAHVTCDFCNKTYDIEPDAVAEVYAKIVQGNN